MFHLHLNYVVHRYYVFDLHVLLQMDFFQILHYMHYNQILLIRLVIMDSMDIQNHANADVLTILVCGIQYNQFFLFVKDYYFYHRQIKFCNNFQMFYQQLYFLQMQQLLLVHSWLAQLRLLLKPFLQLYQKYIRLLLHSYQQYLPILFLFLDFTKWILGTCKKIILIQICFYIYSNGRPVYNLSVWITIRPKGQRRDPR